jgi:hypothetical protein
MAAVARPMPAAMMHANAELNPKWIAKPNAAAV